MHFTEYGDGDEENSMIDLNDISSFLYSIGYINKQKYNSIQKNKEPLKNYEMFFEENQNITVTDSSVKYGTLLTEINKLFNTSSSFEEHFQQYRIYTKTNINFASYLNYLILLVYIINKYDDFLNVNSLLTLEKQKLSIIELDSQNNSFNSEIDKLYNSLQNKSIYSEKEINPNLIILLFIISLNGRIIINPEENNIKNLITNFSLYNKIYFSNIELGILFYLQINIIIQYFSSSNLLSDSSKKQGNKIFNKIDKLNIGANDVSTRNKRKSGILKTDILDKLTKPFTSRNNEKNIINNKTEIGNEINMTEYTTSNNHIHHQINNLNEITKENNIMNEMNNIPNLYLFDNENIKFPNNPHLTIFMIQNYLKLISFYDLCKYNICLLINLTIKNLFVFREEIENSNSNNEKKNKNEIKNEKDNIIKDYYSLKNYSNYDFHIFEKVNVKSLKNISLENVTLFIDEIISSCFNNTYINEFCIKIGSLDDEKRLEELFKVYIHLMKKSNIFFIQELQIISHTLIDNLSINDLHLQYNIIFYILEFFVNSKNIKKSHPKILSFKFNTFKININRDLKNIQLFFDFSKIKEKTIFEYIIKSQKMNILYNKYQSMITLLREFKSYQSKVRLIQSNFRSHQVNFLFSLITKKLVDYIDDIKTSRIRHIRSQIQ